MIKLFFRSGLRSLLRFRQFSLINLIGLTLGFSAVMALTVMLYQFITTNSQFSHKDRLYYVKLHTAEYGDGMMTPFPYLDAALRSCPDIEAGTHIQGWNTPWLKAGHKEFQDATWFVDTGFLRVFSYPLESGDPLTALRGKYNVILAHEMAEKLFGSSAAAAGKTVFMDDSIPLTVTGVLQPIPTNTTVRPQVLLTTALLMRKETGFPQAADWYNQFAENYFLLLPGADTARLNAQLNKIVQANFAVPNRNATAYLVPYTRYVQNESGSLTMAIVKGQVGSVFFLLLVVVANLINLNAAMLLNRQQEMAIRKMMGSSRMNVMLQFALENAMIVITALILAFLLFTNLLMPAMNNILRDHFGAIALNIRHDYPLVGIFVLAGLAIILLAGSWPVLHFGSLRPMDAIKGKIMGAGKGRTYVTRNMFITMQFVLATAFIGISVILNSQIRHMKGAALGLDQEQVLVAPLDLSFRDPKTAAARYDVLLNDLRNNPAVEGVSSSWRVPTYYDDNFNTFYDPATNRSLSMRQTTIDDGMLATYRIPIAEGRNFDAHIDKSDDSPGTHPVILNRRAVTLLGWQNAVGRQLRVQGSNTIYTVIGVTDDYHYGDLARDIDPVIHFFGGPQQLGSYYLSVRIRSGHEAAVQQQLATAFASMPSRRPFTTEWLEHRIDQQYSLLEGILRAINYIAVLTVFIASMGLFGLIALYTRQRVREVGIRKVLGADTVAIVLLLSRNFVVLVGIAL
jgi:putative ABC transport system permease protein